MYHRATGWGEFQRQVNGEARTNADTAQTNANKFF